MGVNKSVLIGASIGSFKNANETGSKVLNTAKVEFGAAVSPAQVCKKLFLDRKHRRREQERKVKNHRFDVRQQGNNMHQLKYKLFGSKEQNKL